MDIVLSYPFSGALYAFFTEQERGEKLPSEIGHSYYRTLYGDKHNEVRDLALTNLLMYEKVFIVPADNIMPQMDNCFSGDDYNNTELGLFTSWKDYNSLRDQIDDKIQSDIKDPVISRLLASVPEWPRKQILFDARFEVALANKYNCPILSAGGRSKLIKRLSELDNATVKQVEHNRIIAVEEYLDIMNLSFDPTNYDLLYQYKHDETLREYATQFRSILSSVDQTNNVRVKMLELFRESMNKEKLYKITSGVLDVSSIIMSIGSLMPFVGPFFSAGSFAATAGSKVAEKSANKTWYEFSNQIKRINNLKELDLLIENELKNTLQGN